MSPALKRIGKWWVDKKLGRGGQGNAFLVHCPGDDHDGSIQFALKELRRVTEKSRERFKREVSALQQIQHPNILNIVESNLEHDPPHYVSEYCEGGDLEKWFKKRSWNSTEVLGVYRQICGAVSFAHEKGIIHRDIKPGNILFREDGTPAIGDFGICSIDDQDDQLTETFEVVGPRDYIAPELTAGGGEPVQPTADIYSLGKLLYFMFTGRHVRRENHRHENWDLANIHADDPSFHLVNRILDRTITERPENRLRSVNEICLEVTKLMETVESGGNVIHPKARQKCIYCGIGTYGVPAAELDTINYARTTGKSRSDARNDFQQYFTINRHSRQFDWKILRCDYCGNLQLFWPDENHGMRESEVMKRWNEE